MSKSLHMTPCYDTPTNDHSVRAKCTGGSLCYEGLDYISEWLNKANVKEALGVEVDEYEGCNFDINRNFLFDGDWMKPYHRLVPGLIAEIPVLIYAGDADFMYVHYINHQNFHRE